MSKRKYICQPKFRKLTNEQVAELRNKYKPYKVTTKMLAAEYGISDTAVKRIVNGWTYCDVPFQKPRIERRRKIGH